MYRSKTSFDDGWSFHLGDDIQRPRRIIAKCFTANQLSELTEEECAFAGVAPRNGRLSSQAVKLHEKTTAKDWKPVTTPHDWRITQVPKPDNRPYVDYPDAWQGFFPTTVGYYRKVFDFRALRDKEHVTLMFDGISGFSDVWLNGMWLGAHSTSYLPFVLEVTELLRSKSPNVLLVRSDIREAEGWWYEAGGIFRRVWIETCNELHVAKDGVYIASSVLNEARAEVRLEIELTNNGPGNAKGMVRVQISAVGWPDKDICATTTARYSIRGCAASTITLETQLQDPKLWNIGQGNLYEACISIQNTQGTVVDETTQRFGIRSIDVGQDGISINGNPSQKIFGVNLHQDFGVYGGALPKRIIERKLQLCMEMGANAIRCAHHPPAPELLDAADRLGILVLTEARLLCSSSLMLDRLQVLLKQSRSHPSVFAYSMGNEEVYAEGTKSARQMMQRMVNVCRALDPTRPTIYGGLLKGRDPIHAIPDIQGMHYRCVLNDIDIAVQVYPTKAHILDEEGLFAAARGVYQYDKFKPYSGAFSRIFEALFDTDDPLDPGPLKLDADAVPSEDIHTNLTKAFSHSSVAGAFVWTGMDYWGEPTPRRFPVISSSYGARDIMGLPKDYYWLLRSIFRTDPVVHGFPHWTWPEKEGANIPFRVYSNCDTIEILVNGKQATDPQILPVKSHMAEVDGGLVYEPGTVLVRGYRDGHAVAEHRQATASAPAGIRLIPDRRVLDSQMPRDLSIVRIAIIDAAGTLLPSNPAVVHLSVDGPGRLVGSHNGDPLYDAENFAATDRISMFNGQAATIVETIEMAGEITLAAKADGLPTAYMTIQVMENGCSDADADAGGILDEALMSGEYTLLE
ncbi:glycoside hydrolase superfamily [Aspergillus pseudoustus]|uniref:Glycoside hydrolase superfamily n=1 Tax=Aspergillus pseudoustus TaxID=1810923 RepID=A0ABR4JDP2_9EURO